MTLDTTERLARCLSYAINAIDRTFGIGYAHKNPKLVADIATLANQIEPKNTIVGQAVITRNYTKGTLAASQPECAE